MVLRVQSWGAVKPPQPPPGGQPGLAGRGGSAGGAAQGLGLTSWCDQGPTVGRGPRTWGVNPLLETLESLKKKIGSSLLLTQTTERDPRIVPPLTPQPGGVL